MMDDSTNPPLPPEFDELEKALDEVLTLLEKSKAYIEAEDLWPSAIIPHFDRIEDKALNAEGAFIGVKYTVRRFLTMINGLRQQRDNATFANYRLTPQLNQLPEREAALISWLISALKNPQDAETKHRLDRLLHHLAKVKRQIESSQRD